MDNNIIFSIIIPHKNTPDLLRRCLESIPRMNDIQIIIVDDNSDENIVDFKWLADLKDKYIKVYLTKEGKGAGYARNVGMRHAKGKWLLFMDADDFFVENAFECMFSYTNSCEEIVYFKSSSCYSDTGRPAKREVKYNKLIDDYLKNMQYAEDRLRYLWNTPWAKMLKKDFIERKDIIFDEVPIANDLIFSCLAGHHATSVKVVDKIVYMVTVSSGSLTNIRNFKLYKIKLIVFFRRNAFLRNVGKKHIQPSLLGRFFQMTFGHERVNRKNYQTKKYIGTQ